MTGDQVSDYQAQARAKVAEEQVALGDLADDQLLEWCAAGESGDAKFFRHLKRGQLAFDHAAGQWYRFEGHWKLCELEEPLAEVEILAQHYEHLAQKWLWRRMAATKAGSEEEVKKAQAVERIILKKIASLQRRHYRQDVLVLAAAGEGSLGLTGREWDADPLLLPCLNGVLELASGVFRKGLPQDFVKTVCPVLWQGFDAPAPKWLAFLNDVMAGDTEKIGFLRRYLGSSIQGQVVDHKLAIFWGPGGRSGKGTLLETLGFVLGPMAGPIQAEILLAQKYPRSPGAPSPEIMAFRAKRLVWASETDEGRKLNAGKVKWLCGGDTLVGRGPYDRREVTFAPSHTLLLITNFRPVVNPADAALWDRLVLVEFPVSFVDDPNGDHQRLRNPQMAAELKEEAAGVLSWLVAGYYEWLENGLLPPSSISSATKDYRLAEDTIAQFLEQCCLLGDGKMARASDLHEGYITFCEGEGLKPKGKNKFFQTLQEEFSKDRDNKGNYYTGLGLKDMVEGV